MSGNETAATGRKSWLMGSLALNALLLLLVVLVLLWFSWPTTESPPATELAASTPPPTPTETAVPDPSPTATTLSPPAAVTQTPLPSPTPTPTPTPTQTETPIPPPEATATPEPAETAVPPSPTPGPTPSLLSSGPDWLIYFNQIRIEAALPYVQADAALSRGAQLHSEYMLRTDRAVHAQDINSPFYSHEGNQAAQNGNIAASGWAEAPDNWGLSYWMTAPFHALPMLNPRLHTTGYGIYRDGASNMKMTATLNVKSGLNEVAESVVYPLTFPRDGGQTWILDSRLPEFPNPLQSCPGYVRPVGAPLIIQIGPGDQTPVVTSSSIMVDGTAVAHCVFTEATYYNENSYQQQVGRTILDQQDAIILIPRQPLEADRTYSVRLVVNGSEIAWQFDTIARRPPFEPGD